MKVGLILGGSVAGQNGENSKTCDANTVKTYVKLTQEEQTKGDLWGDQERDLLKNTVAYSVSKYL